MEQLPLFAEEESFPGFRLRLAAARELDDLIGLAITHLPPPPQGDPAFDRFGLFVEELSRKELPNCRAEHWAPLPPFWPR